ncbi:MAG: DUF2807 domain-containing protein [Bacteroidia bacterium]|nr:DUF2807 domain-containing protein [Bacteroidia bacterium]
MKKILTSILLVLIASACVFAGERTGIRIFKFNGVNVIGNCTEKGIDYSEERKMSSFDKLDCSGPYNVYYVQSKESKVLVEGKKEHVEKLITKVSGSTLSVKLEDGKYNSLVLRVTVYSPDLVSVSKSGSGNFVDDKGHKSDSDLHYSSAGSCTFKLGEISCVKFKVSKSGSGKVECESLKCNGASFSSAGSGSVDIRHFESKSDVDFKFSGSGNVDIEKMFVDGNLGLRISGSGRMDLNGEVKGVVDASISGSGNISGNLRTGGLETHIAGSGSVRFSK